MINAALVGAPAYGQTKFNVLNYGIIHSTATSLPTICNAIFCGAAADQKFVGWFEVEGGEPVRTLTLLAIIFFGSFAVLEQTWLMVYDRIQGSSSRNALVLALWEVLVIGGFIYLAYAFGQIFGDAISSEYTLSDSCNLGTSTTTDMTTNTTDVAMDVAPA